jgi:virginiamycin B lyase
MVNSTDGKVTEYSTSPLFSNSASGPNSFGTTLPYWIKMDPTGNLWFNEHIGNKIARFNTTDNALVEYWIPTQNKLWPPGISNAVQFSIGKNNQIWFSEWTENKLGMLDGSKALPFVVDTTITEYAAKKGDTIQVPLVISAKEQVNLKMIASSTFAKTGSFGNSTFSFSQESFSMNSGETKDITFLVTPSEDLPIGDYTIMIGAENEEVSYMDSVKVHIS